MIKRRRRLGARMMALAGIVLVVASDQLGRVGTGHINDGNLANLITTTASLVGFIIGVAFLVSSIVIGTERLFKRHSKDGGQDEGHN